MTKEQAFMIAKEFLKKRNPDLWDGNGERPDSFDTKLFFFELRKGCKYNFSLSFEWEPIDENKTQHGWFCVCRCWRPSYGRVKKVLQCRAIASKDAIAELILSIL